MVSVSQQSGLLELVRVVDNLVRGSLRVFVKVCTPHLGDPQEWQETSENAQTGHVTLSVPVNKPYDDQSDPGH